MKTATMAVRREACGVDLGALQLSNPVETVCSESAPWHTRPLLTSLLLCGSDSIRERAVVYPVSETQDHTVRVELKTRTCNVINSNNVTTTLAKTLSPTLRRHHTQAAKYAAK